MGLGKKYAKTQAELVYAACRAYRAENSPIADPVARVIAADWHGGMSTQLYSFQSTGAIVDYEGLRMEIQRELKGRQVDSDEFLVLEALLKYVEDAGPRPKVEGWSDQWIS